MQTLSPALVLVIDEIPLISVGLQEVFRSLHPSIQVEHTDSVYTALSSRTFEDHHFGLIILGSDQEASSANLLLSIAGLKERFPGSRIMVYTDRYEAAVVAKVRDGGIDAYVHKFEPTGEIRKAYLQLSAGQPYLSPIFDTLYHDYRLDL